MDPSAAVTCTVMRTGPVATAGAGGVTVMVVGAISTRPINGDPDIHGRCAEGRIGGAVGSAVARDAARVIAIVRGHVEVNRSASVLDADGVDAGGGVAHPVADEIHDPAHQPHLAPVHHN